MMAPLQWFFGWSSRKHISSRKRRRQPDWKRGFQQLLIEPLEDRVLPSMVTWINPNGGNWDVGSNWSTGSAPGAGDVAVINTTSAATITIQAGDTIQVQGVTTGSNDTLSVTGGSLTVTAGSSTLSGALTMTGGSLTASGSGVNLTANGSTNVSGASLYAQSGATLSLPQMTSYTPSSPKLATFQADGAGSVLDVSALTTVNKVGGWQIEATNGGTLNLNGLTSLASQYTVFVTDTGNSTLLDSNLTTLNDVDVTLNGTDTHVADSWTTFTNGTLTVRGGSYSPAGLTDVNDSGLFVFSCGSLALPGLTSDIFQNTNDISVDGSGSVLDLSALTTLKEQGPFSTLYVYATNGGTLNLNGLTTLGNGHVAALSVTDTNNSTLLDSNLTTLNGVNVTLDGTDTHVADSWTTFTNGKLSVFGGTLTLPQTNFTFSSSSLNLGSGPTINVPSSQGLTITLANSGTLTDTTINVGAGTTLALAGGTYLGTTTFNVGQGATVDLTGGQFTTYGGTLTGSGPGTVLFGSGSVVIATGGLTLNFPGSMFQWTSDAFWASLGDLTNLGTMNLAGPADKQLIQDGTLFNYGTIIQTGSGNLGLHSDNKSPTTLVNEAGAYYLIESDSGIDNPSGGQVAVQNAGTIRKTAGTGTSDLYINGTLSNTGTIEADSGTLFLDANSISQVSGGTLSAGTWSALNGATLQFPSGTNIITNNATVSLDGSGASIAALAGLNSNSGSVSLTNGAAFTTAGDFSNSGGLTAGAGSTFTIAGNYTQTAAGTLDVQLGGTPASGQFGQVAAQGAATLDGNLNASLVNGFTPASGQDFPVMTFASASGSFATVTGLGTSLTESLNPISLDLVATAPSSTDLQVTQVSAPTTATAGQSITVSWQVSNAGSQDASGSWQDSVYLSPTPTITSRSILLGAVAQSGSLAASGSYNASWSGAVPALPPGNYYVLVQADSLYQVADANRGNNTRVADTGQLAVSVPALTPGTPSQGTFTAANQDQYYQVSVPAGGSLVVSLASAASSGATALYVSQGPLPTPYSYQEAAVVANQPNQTVTVPQVLTAQTYYILAHSVASNAATSAYTLTVTQGSAMTVSAPAAPYTGGNGGNVTIEIDGTNFTPQTTASLSLGGTTIAASAIDFVNASQIFATFNLSGAAAGSYTLSVQQGGQSVTVPTSFQVTAATPATLNVTLSTPQYVRPARNAIIVITYTNPTTNDMVAPLLTINSTNANVLFSTPDDPNNFVQQAEVLAVAPTGPAGILRPGQSATLTLSLLSNDTIDNDTIPIQVGQIEAGQTIDWSSQQASLQPSTIPTAAWNVIFGNLTAALGSTSDSYNAALAQAATFLSGLGQTTAEFSNVGRLWSFLVAQANAAFPTPTLTSAVDASLPTPGILPLAIDRTFVSTIGGRYTSGIFGLGWVTSWQTSLSTDSSGNVTIDFGGSPSFFVRQANGTYLDTAGEHGTLTLSAGVYTYTDAAGTQYVFGSNGQLNYAQDTNGNLSTLGYNAQNQLVSLTYSNPGNSSEPTEQLSMSYNAQGLVSLVDDGNGNDWSYQYDSAGHLLSVTGPGNLTTAYTYDTGSNPETANTLLSITNPDGSQQDFTYDAQGRLAGTSQNGGADPVTYTYPGEGEVTAVNAAGAQATTWYNDLGLSSRIEDPLGGITDYLYDPSGNLVTYTDAAGNTYQYTYDRNGNLTQIANPLGQADSLTYGPLSNLTSITDAAGNQTQYGYDSAGNLLSITYPDGTQRSFTYDPLGNLSDTVLQNGDPVGYQYNAEGLVSQQTFADGSSQAFTYDAHGNLLTAQTFDSAGTLTGTTTLTYNAANELTSITYPNGQFLNFTYNAQGQRTQSVDQDGFTINYSYDALGRLSQLTDGSGNPIVQYTYNNLGQLTNKLNGNGTYSTYAYDANGNLTSEVNYAGGATVNSSFTYTYNALNEQTSVTDAASNTTTYGYDATGQLTQVTLPGGQTIAYAYNAAGDRTEVITNGTPTSYASNADNEITQVGSATYTYDANGNLHTVTDSSGTSTYTYNDLNQLVSIQNPDGSVQTFQYSPLGFLVGTSTTSGGTNSQTNYLVDPTGLGNVVASYDGSGSLIAHYNYGFGLVSQTGPGGTGYYDFDGSGNTVGITGASGTYVNQYSYLPFGETTIVSAALPNPFTFVGQFGVMQIGSNLFSMRARSYTPGTGQFTSNDPLGLVGGDTNIRCYAANDPLAFADPSGLGRWEDYGHYQYRPDPGNDVGAGPGVPIGFFPNSVTYNGVTGDPGVFHPDTHPVGEYKPFGPKYDDATMKRAIDNVKATNPRYALTPWVYRNGKWYRAYECHSIKQLIDAEYNKLAKVATTGVAASSSTGRTSGDPNALLGPAGFGTQGFIQPTGTWPYTVDFQNDGSVAAQTVTVTQQLDSNLDWSTFQVGSFGFGPVNITVPAGLTQYQTTVAYQNTDGTPLNVDVSLDFNVQTGLLTVSFTSLDPLTGQAPTGVFDGFLPPDNSSHVGEGYVQYTVQPKAGLTTGTAVSQQATVVFDTNAPIATAAAVNTIDAGAPTSSVAPLPTQTQGTTFTVSWSGQDDPGGSGIATYDIFVSDNGGPFTAFLSGTTQTSASFTGQLGHTYGFYSVATDNVGNRQPTPTAAQATTTVSTQAATTTSVASDHPAGSTYGQLVTFTATVSSSVGTPTGSVQFQVDGANYGSAVALTGGVASISTAGLAAGSHTIVAFYSSDSSSFLNSDNQANPVSQAVNPAPLTITADDQTKVYGSAVPTLTASYAGFVNGDTPASLTTPPSLSTTAISGSPVGSYTITAGGAVDPNYSISYVAGTLTVAQATPSFSNLSAPSIVYGTASTTISGQLQGNAGVQPVPAGETVQVTLNGVTQTATLDGSDNFSTTFATGTLGVAGSPYPITFWYGGDTNFQAASGSSTLTVVNLLASGSPFNATEGATFKGAVATFIDANKSYPSASYMAVINWGDGSTSTGTVLATTTKGHFTVLGSHVYAEEGSYSASVNVRDLGGNSATALTSAAVADASLRATGKTVYSTEGLTFSGTVARFTDRNPAAPASDFTATITWGDGNSSTGTVVSLGKGSFAIVGTNTYAEQGTYAVGVQVTDAGGSTAAITATAAVADARLKALGVTITPTEGQAFSGTVATFTDANPNPQLNDFTATIAWGDGQSSSATIVANGAGGFAVLGSHTYADKANDTIKVTITDAGGSTTQANSTARVADAPLAGTIVAVTGVHGQATTATVATFTDGNPTGPVGDFTATIVWGDGHTATGSVVVDPAGGFDVVGTNTYQRTGAFAITVTVVDKDGSRTTLEGKAHIT
jgi:RHS repeat-associated protein